VGGAGIVSAPRLLAPRAFHHPWRPLPPGPEPTRRRMTPSPRGRSRGLADARHMSSGLNPCCTGRDSRGFAGIPGIQPRMGRPRPCPPSRRALTGLIRRRIRRGPWGTSGEQPRRRSQMGPTAAGGCAGLLGRGESEGAAGRPGRGQRGSGGEEPEMDQDLLHYLRISEERQQRHWHAPLSGRVLRTGQGFYGQHPAQQVRPGNSPLAVATARPETGCGWRRRHAGERYGRGMVAARARPRGVPPPRATSWRTCSWTETNGRPGGSGKPVPVLPRARPRRNMPPSRRTGAGV
jgi:hypothetical protein